MRTCLYGVDDNPDGHSNWPSTRGDDYMAFPGYMVRRKSFKNIINMLNSLCEKMKEAHPAHFHTQQDYVVHMLVRSQLHN